MDSGSRPAGDPGMTMRRGGTDRGGARQFIGRNRFARRRERTHAMRALVSFYLAIGIVLLVVGFVATGPCPEKNSDVVSNVVFVLGWPVYLYDDVVHGNT